MRTLLFLLSAILFSQLANAHGPTPQKVKHYVLIAAPVDKVWQVVKDFDKIADWHPGISNSQGQQSNESGTERQITLQNGGVLTESLDYYSDETHEYSYRLQKENIDVIPVSFYTASLQLTDENGQTRVVWKSRFYRGDTGNFPPDNLNDESATKAMDALIKQGLSGLSDRVKSM